MGSDESCYSNEPVACSLSLSVSLRKHWTCSFYDSRNIWSTLLTLCLQPSYVKSFFSCSVVFSTIFLLVLLFLDIFIFFDCFFLFIPCLSSLFLLSPSRIRLFIGWFISVCGTCKEWLHLMVQCSWRTMTRAFLSSAPMAFMSSTHAAYCFHNVDDSLSKATESFLPFCSQAKLLNTPLALIFWHW